MRAFLVLLLATAAAPAAAEPPVPAAAPPAPDHAAQEHVASAMRWFFGPAATGPEAPRRIDLADALESMKLPVPTSGHHGNSNGHGTGALAFGGGWAAGVVIAPPAHPDARPWPHGILMTPPETADANAIALGGDGFPGFEPRRAPGWSKRIAETLQGGLASLFAFALPHSL